MGCDEFVLETPAYWLIHTAFLRQRETGILRKESNAVVTLDSSLLIMHWVSEAD